jgi:hypothetical protein
MSSRWARTRQELSRHELADDVVGQTEQVVVSCFGCTHAAHFGNNLAFRRRFDLDVLDRGLAVRRLVAFYVQQCNAVSPHSALNWRTPVEVYFGRTAREARMAVNRATTCEKCRVS